MSIIVLTARDQVSDRIRGLDAGANALQATRSESGRRAFTAVGTGLGLAIVSTIVGREHGSLELQSPPPGLAGVLRQPCA